MIILLFIIDYVLFIIIYNYSYKNFTIPKDWIFQN